MKRKLISLLVGVGLIAAFFIGCSAEIILTSVNGGVVNARSETLGGIGNVTVTFTPVDDGVKQTTTTSSDGSFNMAYTGEGQYKVTASLSGWFFIPQTVYVGGWLQSVPDILGIALDSNTKVRDEAISFILTWNSTYKDLDGFLTFPDGSGTGDGFEGLHDPATSDAFTNPYSSAPLGSTGFAPDTIARESVGPAYIVPGLVTSSKNTVADVLGEGTDSRPAIELDRDDRNGAGPEVITVRTLPFWPSTYNTIATYSVPSNFDTLLPASVDSTSVEWTWTGVMEYYVDGWNSDDADGVREDSGHLISAEDGSGADAVLHIVQGSRLLGAFHVPEYANIRTASLVKVNLFIGYRASLGDYVSYFQFVPDIQIVNYDGGAGILSVRDEPAQVFGAFGPIR